MIRHIQKTLTMIENEGKTLMQRLYTKEDIQLCRDELACVNEKDLSNLRRHIEELDILLNRQSPIRRYYLPLQSSTKTAENFYGNSSCIFTIMQLLGVTTVNLNNNGLRWSEINPFIKTHLSQLKSLDLRNNNLDVDSSDGWEEFKSLLSHSSIIKLDIRDNFISYAETKAVKQIIKSNNEKAGTVFSWPTKPSLFAPKNSYPPARSSLQKPSELTETHNPLFFVKSQPYQRAKNAPIESEVNERINFKLG